MHRNMGTEYRLVGVGDQVGERFMEWPIGSAQFLVAAPEQHQRAGLVRAAGQLRHQRRLALPGLTREEDDLASRSGKGPLRRVTEDLELEGSPDDTDPGRAGES